MVSDSSIATDVWSEIRSILVSSNLQVTTNDGVKDASIEASYNDKNTSKPQVIIYPISHDESEWKFGSFEGKKLINVQLEIYHNTTRGIDQLEGQVLEPIKNTEIPGIELVGITTDYAFTNPMLTKYHLKTITLTYDRE